MKTMRVAKKEVILWLFAGLLFIYGTVTAVLVHTKYESKRWALWQIMAPAANVFDEELFFVWHEHEFIFPDGTSYLLKIDRKTELKGYHFPIQRRELIKRVAGWAKFISDKSYSSQVLSYYYCKGGAIKLFNRDVKAINYRSYHTNGDLYFSYVFPLKCRGNNEL